MLNLTIKDLLEIIPDFGFLEKSPLINNDEIQVGWHAQIIAKSGKTISAGAHVDSETAVRIAVAEAIERICFSGLKKSSLKQELLLDEFPTTCGFAAEFQKDATLFRAISEAVERWAWSQWIDRGYTLPVEEKIPSLSALAMFF